MPITKNAQSAQTQINTFLHTFTGADGGISFINFRVKYLEIEAMAADGDVGAAEIMSKVQGVVNLIQHFGEFDNENI